MAKIFDSTLLPQDATKEENTKAILDLLKKMNTFADVLIPLGHIHTQLPGTQAPSVLWPWATWKNISTSFSGSFFRVEGGNALKFNGGKQSNAMAHHWHNFYVRTPNWTGATGSTWQMPGQSGTNTNFASNDGVRDAISDGTNPAPNLDTENRPDNYTIRIWKRTA